MERASRIELPFRPWQGHVIATIRRPQHVLKLGIEPRWHVFQTCAVTDLATSAENYNKWTHQDLNLKPSVCKTDALAN